ncbi:hypothetical protein L345_04253, partial [Ophiophagus hannah]
MNTVSDKRKRGKERQKER